MQNTTTTVPGQLQSITEYIKQKHGNKPTYSQFFNSYLEKFRELYPNSTAPKNDLLGMFYDDFINHNTIIGY